MLWRSLCYDNACLLDAFSDGSTACIVYDTTLANVLLVILGHRVSRAGFVSLSASGALITKLEINNDTGFLYSV